MAQPEASLIPLGEGLSMKADEVTMHRDDSMPRKHPAMCRDVIFCPWKSAQVAITPSRTIADLRCGLWPLDPQIASRIAKSRKAVPNLPNPLAERYVT